MRLVPKGEKCAGVVQKKCGGGKGGKCDYAEINGPHNPPLSEPKSRAHGKSKYASLGAQKKAVPPPSEAWPGPIIDGELHGFTRAVVSDGGGGWGQDRSRRVGCWGQMRTLWGGGSPVAVESACGKTSCFA